MAARATPSLAAAGPRRLLRKVGGPLLVYHAMIFAGAFLLITGARWGTWFLLGILLVVAGIAVELAILAWSASLTRSVRPAVESPRGVEPGALAPSSRRICVACGREGNPEAVVCARCGRSVVSLGSTG